MRLAAESSSIKVKSQTQNIGRGQPGAAGGFAIAPSTRSRRKVNYTDNMGNEDDNGEDKMDDDGDYMDDEAGNESDDIEPSRGGRLTGPELAAVAFGVNNAEEFRNLGNHIPSALTAQDPVADSEGDISMNGVENATTNSADKPLVSYTAEETAKLETFQDARAKLTLDRDRHHDKEIFFDLVRTRGKKIQEELKKTDKGSRGDICGFDARLAWSNEEFDEWRFSAQGQKCLKDKEPLTPPEAETTENGDGAMVDVAAAGTRGACLKKKCQQHNQWTNVFTGNIHADMTKVEDDIRKLDEEVKGVKEAAVLRALEGK